jgi:hypothetical protein
MVWPHIAPKHAKQKMSLFRKKPPKKTRAEGSFFEKVTFSVSHASAPYMAKPFLEHCRATVGGCWTGCQPSVSYFGGPWRHVFAPKRAICERFFFIFQWGFCPKGQSLKGNTCQTKGIKDKNLKKKPMSSLQCVLSISAIFFAF